MSQVIQRALIDVKNSVPELNSLSDDCVYGVIALKYFFNGGKLDKLDFKNSYTDGPNDGGIDLIAVEESDLKKSLVLIQSKNVSDVNSKDDIKDIFLKMSQTVSDFRNERYGGYNDRLKRIYLEKYDDTSDDSNFTIKLALFLGFDKDDNYKIKIQEHLSKVTELADFDLVIFYESDIIQQIQSFEEERKYVPNDKIKIFDSHGIIVTGANGILVNVSANSLRKIYTKHKSAGLFEQNFRYFIKNEKIDDQIEESLKSKRDYFWFLNNGIIIGCKDFWVDGNNVKLTDFSIVNGCQTTTILGTYKGSNQDFDFPIPCKIVKPDKKGEDYFNQFISLIAETSNSQKPISDRDLKSNLAEQRNLQRMLKQDDPKIYLEIKRGETILKAKGIESWQKIKNDQLGQLLLSTILQQPGTARSSKKKIFGDKLIYNRVFKRSHDKRTIVDLLKLSFYYDAFINVSELNEKQSNIAENGKYTILAILCFLIKNKRELLNMRLDVNSADWVSDITSDNLSGYLFNQNRPDDFEGILYSLLLQIIRTLSVLYDSRDKLETSVTNFFKTDKKYHSIILDRIKSEYIQDSYEYKRLNEKLCQVFV